MSSLMIKVNNLSKRYRIGAAQKDYKTFREAIMEGISAPVRNLARLRSLTRFKEGYEEDVIWALKDVSFEACPELSRRMQRGEVVGIPSLRQPFDRAQDKARYKRRAQDKHRPQRGGENHT